MSIRRAYQTLHQCPEGGMKGGPHRGSWTSAVARRRPSPEYAATGETHRALVRDARLMTNWSSVLASANPLRKG